MIANIIFFTLVALGILFSVIRIFKGNTHFDRVLGIDVINIIIVTVILLFMSDYVRLFDQYLTENITIIIAPSIGIAPTRKSNINHPDNPAIFSINITFSIGTQAHQAFSLKPVF